MTDFELSSADKDDLSVFSHQRENVFSIKSDVKTFSPNSIFRRGVTRIIIRKNSVLRYFEHFDKGKASHVKRAERIYLGTFSRNFRVQTVDNFNYILKLKPHLTKTHNWEMIYDAILSKLFKEPLSVPKLEQFDHSHEMFPRTDILCTEMCKGESLYIKTRANDSEYSTMYKNLGEGIKNLHKLRFRNYGLIDAYGLIVHGKVEGRHKNWSEYLTSNLGVHLDYLRLNKIFDRCNLGSIAKYLEELNYINDVPNSLLHGDLSDKNIFLNEDRSLELIDFEDSLLGDPIFEIAAWAKHQNHLNYVNDFISGYYSEEPLPEYFWRRFYLYLIRLSISDLVWLIRSKTKEKWRVKNTCENIKSAISFLESMEP